MTGDDVLNTTRGWERHKLDVTMLEISDSLDVKLNSEFEKLELLDTKKLGVLFSLTSVQRKLSFVDGKFVELSLLVLSFNSKFSKKV